MIAWRARDAYWIPDPLERGDIDRELSNRVWCENWGVSLEVQQPTEDPPRLYTWEFTIGSTRTFERSEPMSELELSHACLTDGGGWGFTFVRIDP